VTTVVHTFIYGRNRHAIALKVNMKGRGYRELEALKHIRNQKEKGTLKGSEYIMDPLIILSIREKMGNVSYSCWR